MGIEFLKSRNEEDHIRIPKAEYITFRAALRDARKRAGFTQKQLAERLEAPQSFVSKYESGERRLDVVELRRVCAALSISTSQFLARLESRIKGSPDG